MRGPHAAVRKAKILDELISDFLERFRVHPACSAAMTARRGAVLAFGLHLGEKPEARRRGPIESPHEIERQYQEPNENYKTMAYGKMSAYVIG